MKKNPLTILLISCDWRNIFQTQFHELLEKLERDRWAPSLNHFFLFSWAKVSYTERKNSRFFSVHRKTIWSKVKPLYEIASLWAVPAVLKSHLAHTPTEKPDIIATYDFGFLPTAWRIQKKHGGKIVMCINNMPRLYSATRRFGALKSMYSSMLERCFKNIPDYYFTINQSMKEYLLKLGIPDAKIHVFAMNTIDRDREFIAAAKANSAAQKHIVHTQYDILPEEKILICVARLEAEKGHARLLELFSGLDEKTHLILLGQGSFEKSLREQARNLGIESRVHFAGFVQRNDIWNYYFEADAFILLSKVEALGVVFWEAMYAGMPVIGSTAPGIVETIGEDNEKGIILKENATQEDFRHVIEYSLVPSPERTARLDAAKSYVEEQIKNSLIINDII